MQPAARLSHVAAATLHVITRQLTTPFPCPPPPSPPPPSSPLAPQAFFDDAARDDHSAKLFGHVTGPQFRQVLTTKLDWVVANEESALLIEKFKHEDKPEFINYIAFANTVDPPERYLNDY